MWGLLAIPISGAFITAGLVNLTFGAALVGHWVGFGFGLLGLGAFGLRLYAERRYPQQARDAWRAQFLDHSLHAALDSLPPVIIMPPPRGRPVAISDRTAPPIP